MQQRNRMRFQTASRLASELRNMYRDNYLPLANRLANHNTPRSLFMTHLLRDVVMIDRKEKEIVVAHDRIQFSPPDYLAIPKDIEDGECKQRCAAGTRAKKSRHDYGMIQELNRQGADKAYGPLGF